MKNPYHILWLFWMVSALYWGLTSTTIQRPIPLPQHHMLLDTGWKWHRGDLPDWARPEFDDHKWESIDPSREVIDLPQIQNGNIIWLRRRVRPDTTLLGIPIALRVAHVGASEIYINGQLAKRLGRLTPPPVKGGYYMTSLRLPENQTEFSIAVRCALQKGLPYNRFGNMPNFFFHLTLVQAEENENLISHLIKTLMVSSYLKIGAFLVLFLLHFALYIFYPAQKANLYFSGMALCYGIHVLMYAIFMTFTPADNLPLIVYAGLLRGPIYTLAYLLLLRAFFALFEYKPDLVFSSTAAGCVFLLTVFFGNYKQGVQLSEIWTTNICSMACLYVTIRALLDKKKNALLLLFGVLLSTTALEVRYFITFYPIFPELQKVPHSHLIDIQIDFIGVMSIPICISWFLGENFARLSGDLAARLNEVQRLAHEKQQILISHNRELERQVAQRTEQIQTQSNLIQQQRLMQMETEFEQKLANTEMTALRAQMNPHFIFNCLNSIKLYTLENQADKACEYLTKFTRLIRRVLENSRSEMVTLRNELEAIQLYIDLEAMRFKHKLNYQITIDPQIDQVYLRLPPLLLQPYIENAIWHGLMHKPEGGTITIVIGQQREDLLHIEISDDGVGRSRSAELKSKSAGKHKSFGMQVTQDRIRMINKLFSIQAEIQVIDLTSPSGENLGTRVIVQIPV